MKPRDLLQSLPSAALRPAVGWLSSLDHSQDKVSSGTSSMVYELRVYHTYEGKLDDLLRRFREHTMRLFEKHGIRNVAYWTPIEEPLKGRTLFYILAHPSREAANANWDAFRNDPEWQAARDKSEANGKQVEKVESTFLSLTDFSRPSAELRPLSSRISCSCIPSLPGQAKRELLPLQAVFATSSPQIPFPCNKFWLDFVHHLEARSPAGTAVITPG